jgi:serine protease AprX
VRVLNLSVGGDEELRLKDSPVDQSVQRLVREGVTVVAAAGNAGQRKLVPPASAPFAITVGGLDDQNLLDSKTYRIWHCNYGPTVDGVFKPELVAPSIWVAAPILPESKQLGEARALERLATTPDHRVVQVMERLKEDNLIPAEVHGIDPESIRLSARRLQAERQYVDAAYKRVEGTSFAAPIISSVAACLIEAHPRITPLRLKEILLGTAEHVTGVPIERQGYGVVNPRAAIARVLRESGAPLEGLPYSPHLDVRGHVVFLFHSPIVAPVAVVGTFNNWETTLDPFVLVRPRVWAAAVSGLKAGDYSYQFLLEDGTLTDDADNPLREPDGAGGFLSRIAIPKGKR